MNYTLLELIFFIIFLVLFLPDIYIQINTWQSRIKIGRFSSTYVWKRKLINRSIKWLNRTPTVKLTDNSRLILVDIIKGNYKRSAIQYWQEAALVLGLFQEFKNSKNKNIKESIDIYIDSKIDASGNWSVLPKEIDGAIVSYALLNIDWVDKNKVRPAVDAIWILIQDLIGTDGTVQYRKTMPDYRYVDTIGFICPFLVTYGVQYGKEDAINLAIKQIEDFNRFGMYPEKGIPCHTYHIQSKLTIGLFGWGRGLGWYAIGLIDSWKALPNEHAKKTQLTDFVIEFAKMAASFQNENGSWNWIVSSKEARQDSSTTATLLWFFSNASSIDSISDLCNRVIDAAIHYLMTVTRRDGAIDFSQGDTKAIGIHSQEFDILPFTQGFALRSVSYLNKN